MSDCHISSSNIIDELVPALNHLMNTQRQTSSSSLVSMTKHIESSLSPQISKNEPIESLPVPPTTKATQLSPAFLNTKPVESTTVNGQIPSPKSITNMPSYSFNRPFSNRLGMMISPNPKSTSRQIESTINSQQSSIIDKQDKSSTSKCKLFFFFLFYSFSLYILSCFL